MDTPFRTAGPRPPIIISANASLTPVSHAPLSHQPTCREVKNSWSTHWGDGGHFKVLRDGHACGVASDAAYAVVADSVL